MKKISIGVIIATFNGEKYIKEQLESILAQTYPVNEIVISDDGSFDNTKTIINQIKEENPSVKITLVEHKSTGNISDNFYNAFTFLRNVDYFFFCDQDDVWLDNKVETFCDTINKTNGPDVLFSDAYVTDEQLKPNEKSLIQILGHKLYNDLINAHGFYIFEQNNHNLIRILKWNIMTGMNSCVSYSFFEKNQPMPYGVLHDNWILRICFFNGTICYIPEKTAFYRQHQNNSVGIQRKKNFKTKKKKIMKYLEGIENLYNSLLFLQKNTSNFSNEIMKKTLSCFIAFYEKRVNSLQKRNVLLILLNILNGNYIKYTYNAFRSITNDIGYCVLYRKNNSLERIKRK